MSTKHPEKHSKRIHWFVYHQMKWLFNSPTTPSEFWLAVMGTQTIISYRCSWSRLIWSTPLHRINFFHSTRLCVSNDVINMRHESSNQGGRWSKKIPAARSVAFRQTRTTAMFFVAVSLVAGFQKNGGFNFREQGALLTHRVMLLTSQSVTCGVKNSHLSTCSDSLEPWPSRY